MQDNSSESDNQAHLKKVLSPLMLWGLGVGYVISGMYFGWNLGLKEGGTLGLAIATGIVIVLYACFSFSYAELACAIPKAGGVFDYANKAFGDHVGFIAGIAQMIEFIFAPPAIAFGIGAYFNLFFPDIPILWISLAAYFVFTALNIYGVKAAATFELWITIIAVVEILIFAGVTLPHFKWANMQQNAWPNGWFGVVAALPFAIWFLYLLATYVGLYATQGTESSFQTAISCLAFASIGMIITPGGIGAYAYFMAKVLELNGVDYTLGLANGTLQWFSQFIIILVLGGIALIALPLFNKQKI